MPNEPTYTWDAVLAAVPQPTTDQSALYALAIPAADLVQSGARIRSEKILTDLVRWGGTVAEFLPKATAAQRRSLLGFSEGFFRVTVHEGAKLRGMVASRSESVDEREAKRVALVNAAAQAYADGLDERDRLHNALVGLQRYDATLKERLDLARGRVVDAESLSRSLHALTALTRDLLADPTSIVARQLAEGGVTEDELAALDAAADKAKDTDDDAAGARTQGPVTQADLDMQDGTCLAHMDRLMRIFNGAHEKDPSIPALLPIATRRIFSPNRKRPQGDPSPTGGGNDPK
jgi:hypothetical protein